MDNPIDMTLTLPEVDQPHLKGQIRVNQYAAMLAAVAVVGLLLIAGFWAMNFFVAPAVGSVMDYRPAPIVGNVGVLVTPAEAKAKFRAAHPEWLEVGE